MNRVLTVSLLLAASAAVAQVPSGPPVGEKTPPLKVFAATGPQAGKELECVADRAARPSVFVLVREWDRPTARFLKVLDGAVKEESAEGAVVAAWLTDTKDETRAYLPKAQQSLQLENTTLAVFLGDRAGPDGWNVSPDARLTVAVCAKGRVTANFGFTSVNETDARGVRAALKKAVDGK